MKCSMIALFLALVPSSVASAQKAEQQGREVALEANRRASEYGDLSASLLMVIRNGRGEERTRELTVTALEVDEFEERMVVRFEAPRDLRGTALLTVNRRDGSSDQWLYLPALRRTKRIADARQSGSFMGSEFSYEDIGTMEVDRYTYRLVESDTLDGLPAWVVEQHRKGSSSQYRRQLVWYDQHEYRVLRIDYFDRRDTLLKTLSLRKFHRYAARFWRPDVMEMVNHQTGASTVLQWSDHVLGGGLSRRDFEPNRLKHSG